MISRCSFSEFFWEAIFYSKITQTLPTPGRMVVYPSTLPRIDSHSDVENAWQTIHARVNVGPRRFQRMYEGFSARVRLFPSGNPWVPWRRNPQHSSSWPFISWPWLTLVTHATARVPTTCVPSTIWKYMSYQQGLRLQHIMHFSFGIILKYYSQGLSPLGSTLSPFFPPPSPNSLPIMWTLSPPSLIHHGRSAPAGVYILLMCCIYIQIQNPGPWPSILRLSGLIKHISLLAYTKLDSPSYNTYLQSFFRSWFTSSLGLGDTTIPLPLFFH